jgi:hypothetical protein
VDTGSRQENASDKKALVRRTKVRLKSQRSFKPGLSKAGLFALRHRYSPWKSGTGCSMLAPSLDKKARNHITGGSAQ